MPLCLSRTASRALAGVAAAVIVASASAEPKKNPESPLIKVAELRLGQPRQGAACAVLDGSIYVFGGATTMDQVFRAEWRTMRDGVPQVRRSFESGLPGRVGIIDVEKVDTRTAKVMPAPGRLLVRRYHAVIEHAGKFFLFGGQGEGTGGEAFERRVEIYDPATGEVTYGPDMPEPRCGMAAVKLGSKAHLIGGTKFKGGTTGAQTNQVDIFDLELGTWTTGLPMPTPRESRAEVVGEFILVVGGYRSREAVAEVEMFVPRENRWKSLPALDRPVSAHALALLDDRLYLFGNYSDQSSTLAYNLRTRKTESVSAGFEGRRHSCAAVVGERIYVIGGNTGPEAGTELDRIEVFARNPDFAPR